MRAPARAPFGVRLPASAASPLLHSVGSSTQGAAHLQPLPRGSLLLASRCGLRCAHPSVVPFHGGRRECCQSRHALSKTRVEITPVQPWQTSGIARYQAKVTPDLARKRRTRRRHGTRARRAVASAVVGLRRSPSGGVALWRGRVGRGTRLQAPPRAVASGRRARRHCSANASKTAPSALPLSLPPSAKPAPGVLLDLKPYPPLKRDLARGAPKALRQRLLPPQPLRSRSGRRYAATVYHSAPTCVGTSFRRLIRRKSVTIWG